MVAEAFTRARADIPVHDLLNRAFDKLSYRWYAIDMSGEVWCMTFSNEANPDMLFYNDIPARMVTAELTLHLHAADMLRPVRTRRNAFPHWIDKSA